MKLAPSLALVSILAVAAHAQVVAPEGAPPSTGPSAVSTTQPAATNPATAAAMATLERYNEAVRSGDPAAVEAILLVNGDTQKRMVEVAKTLIKASHGLYAATLEKFGKESLEKNNVTREQFPSAFPELPLEQAKIRLEGEKAAVRFGPDESGPAVLTLVKSGADWKLSGDELLGNMTEQQLKEQSTVIGAVVSVMEKTAADVKSGKIESPDEVVVLWNHRVQKAVSEARMKQMESELPPGMGPTTAPGAAPAPAPLPAPAGDGMD